MCKINGILNIICSFIIFLTFCAVCYGSDSAKQKDVLSAKDVKNYEVVVPMVLGLDSRTALTINEINVIDKKVFNNLLKYKRLLVFEINTTGLKYTQTWVDKLQDIAKKIKKYPNTIVIIEGFRNTEMSEKENIEMSKEHALFVASVFRDTYSIKNTMAVIGRGLEKNENFIYNCVIISLIKDINPSQSIQ
ncbi:MAG: OmpA family protein [Endomicrobiaceae bacterium]|nr:OmpA family protein [Endomicrobiaceae bacterium]